MANRRTAPLWRSCALLGGATASLGRAAYRDAKVTLCAVVCCTGVVTFGQALWCEGVVP